MSIDEGFLCCGLRLECVNTTYCVRAERLRLDADQRQDIFDPISIKKIHIVSMSCGLFSINYLTAFCKLRVKRDLHESQDVVFGGLIRIMRS